MPLLRIGSAGGRSSWGLPYVLSLSNLNWWYDWPHVYCRYCLFRLCPFLFWRWLIWWWTNRDLWSPWASWLLCLHDDFPTRLFSHNDSRRRYLRQFLVIFLKLLLRFLSNVTHTHLEQSTTSPQVRNLVIINIRLKFLQIIALMFNTLFLASWRVSL